MPMQTISDSDVRMSSIVYHGPLPTTSEPENVQSIPWHIRRRQKLKKTICLVTLIFLLILCVTLAYTTTYFYLNDIDNMSLTANGVCLTPGCIKTAANILDSMDETVDPCHNFYQFACGRWMEEHTIPDYKSSLSTLTDAQEKLNLKLRALIEKPMTDSDLKFVKIIKDMYSSCMDLESIENSGAEPLKNFLATLGGWPVVLGENWEGSNFDWIRTLFTLRQHGYNPNILLHSYVIPDRKNVTKHIIELDRQSFGESISTLIKGLNDTSSTEAYFKWMIKIANKLGANEVTSRTELLEVLNFEMILANFSQDGDERESTRKHYNKYSVKQLQESVPQIDWLRYFNGLLNDPISDNELLLVREPEYIKKLGEQIVRKDKRVIANYMIWRVIARSLTLLSKDWRELSKEDDLANTKTNQKTPRWKICLDVLKYPLVAPNSFGIALGSLYVRHHFKKEIKDEVLQLIKYVRREVLTILDNTDWLDDKTKMVAKGKAKSMIQIIGYPQELLNDSLVNEIYENLKITNESYYNNIMSFNKWHYDGIFSQIKKPNIRGEWKKNSFVADVDAYYMPMENSITFMAALLKTFTFFDKDKPKYANFGAIGYITGHEITHGFDTFGREYDENGNEKNWWSETSDDAFKEKVKCIIEQYGNYTAENGQQLNSNLTQGEDVSDNGGLKAAYLAYKSWVRDHGTESKLPGLKYTPRQLFWISAANTCCVKYTLKGLEQDILKDYHSPWSFRLIGMVSNRPEFAKDFQCPLGSPMNPYKKCQVW